MAEYADVVFNIPVDRSFLYRLPADLSMGSYPDRMGFRVIAPLGKRKLMGYVVSTRSEKPETDYEIRDIERVIDAKSPIDSHTMDLARWIRRIYMCSLGEALSTIIPSGRREIDSSEVFFEEGETGRPDLTLSEQQKNAIDAILSRRQDSFYLFGVTGSGKTEVFLRVAEALLEEGRSVIYLVPEISLVHQVVELCARRFGEAVTVLHSGMTPSQRLKSWFRALGGEAKIAIGARSAVFAPMRNLGLIVIDEEHETSYKSSSTPRYHARQVAYYRSRKERSLLVMGSATPSFEAYHQMAEGRLRRLDLPHRLSGGAMPEVEIIDMRRERGILSKALRTAMGSVLAANRQAILFLNRRGFAHLFYCRSCGFELKCRHCSVTLTYHKKRNIMICHYCGYRLAPVEVCPGCGSLDIGYTGFGTERIEEEVRGLFPGARVRRIDTDTVRSKQQMRRSLIAFRNREIDILMGTQMVAKGLNFPGVRLVGVVSADVGLQLPDFRAFERTFALIVQVSGRAGRAMPDGKVIVQTFRPDNPVIQKAAQRKIEEFYSEELAARKKLRFPPFVRMIRVVIRSRKKQRCLELTRDIRALLSRAAAAEIEVLGPVECPLALIAGNHRYHVIFRGREFRLLHDHVQSVLSRLTIPGRTYLEVDVDLLSLL